MVKSHVALVARVVEQTDPSYSSSKEASLLETLLEGPSLTASFSPQAAAVKATPPPPGRLLGRGHAGPVCNQVGAYFGPAPDA